MPRSRSRWIPKGSAPATPTRRSGRSSTELPDDVAQIVRTRTAGVPVETLFFWVSIGAMSEELCAQHVRTLCGQLAPLLADA